MGNLVLANPTVESSKRSARRSAKKAERRAQRECLLSLVDELGWTLCAFCRHADWQGSGCDEGWNECRHPLQAVEACAEYIDPSTDCWGFRLDMSMEEAVDIVGLALSRFDPGACQWHRREVDGRLVMEGRERPEWKAAQVDKDMGWPPGTAQTGYGAAHMGSPD